MMPKHHGGYVHQAAEQNTLQAEVTEESDGFMVGALHTVISVFSYVSMLCQKRVKIGNDPIVFVSDVPLAHNGLLVPAVTVIEDFLRDPFLGKPVPGAVPGGGSTDLGRKFF